MRGSQWTALGLIALGFGTSHIATRAAFAAGMGPWTIVATRMVLAAAIVAIVLALRGELRPTRFEARVGLVMAVFNLAVPYLLITYALESASAGFVALISALYPLVTALFAHWMLPTEPMTVPKTAGLAVGFAGAALLALSGDSGLAQGGNALLAATLSLGAVATIGYSGAYARRAADRYRFLPVTGTQLVFGAVMLVPAMLLVEGSPLDTGTAGWLLVAYMATVSTVLPFTLYYRLSQQVSATRVSLVGYLTPVVAVVGGVILLGERIQPGIVAAGALIFLGVALTDRAERARPAVRGRPG